MTPAIYNERFGCRERLFSMLPDAAFLFWSKTPTHAFSVLNYGVASRASFAVGARENGTGKATLIQSSLGDTEENTTGGMISRVLGGRRALLRWVRNAFDKAGLQDANNVALVPQFHNFVLAEYAAGQYVLLTVD